MNPLALISRATEIAAVVLIGAALGLIQILIGGTRLIYSIPGYALLALVGLLTIFSLGKRTPRPDQLCLLSAATFFGYILIRNLFSPVAYVARPDLYSVLGGLTVYFFIACVCTSAKARSGLVFFLLALGLVHVVIGAIQFRDGNNFMLIPFLGRFDYGRRASGFYVCPNHLAGLLEVLAIFAISLVCWSRFPAWSKLLVGYSTAVCFLGIVLTGSRGGYASTIIGLLVFAVLSLIVLRRSSRRLFWCVGGLGAVVALVLAVVTVFFVHKSDFLTQRAQNIFDSTPVRLDLWHAAIQQWKAQPWIGTGSGTYLYYGRLFRTERMQQDPIDAHNDYLHLLAEYGAVGGALFLFFLCAHLRAGWKSFRRSGPQHVTVVPDLLNDGLALNIGALASVGAYMAHSVVDFNLHIPANALLLAFVFGLLANAGVEQRDERDEATMSILSWRILLPVLGLVVMVQCFRLLPAEYFSERARTAQRDDQPEIAAAFASRGLQTEKENPNLYLCLASARFTICDRLSDLQARVQCYAEPVTLLEKARALAPTDRNVLVQLALGYDAVHRYPEAERIFYEAKKSDPKSVYLDQIYKSHLTLWRTESGD